MSRQIERILKFGTHKRHRRKKDRIGVIGTAKGRVDMNGPQNRRQDTYKQLNITKCYKGVDIYYRIRSKEHKNVGAKEFILNSNLLSDQHQLSHWYDVKVYIPSTSLCEFSDQGLEFRVHYLPSTLNGAHIHKDINIHVSFQEQYITLMHFSCPYRNMRSSVSEYTDLWKNNTLEMIHRCGLAFLFDKT